MYIHTLCMKMRKAHTLIYTLPLHDALPICSNARTCTPLPRSLPPGPQPINCRPSCPSSCPARPTPPQKIATRRAGTCSRSEEHTSELQSRLHLVCRLLLEKKKQILYTNIVQ